MQNDGAQGILRCRHSGENVFLVSFASTAVSMTREFFGVSLILPIVFGLDGLLWSFPAAGLLTFIIAIFFIRQTYPEPKNDLVFPTGSDIIGKKGGGRMVLVLGNSWNPGNFAAGELFFAPRQRSEVPNDLEKYLYKLPNTPQYSPYARQVREMIDKALAIPYEDVWTTSQDGLRLHGKFYPAADPKAPVQILCHGYQSVAEKDFCGGLPMGLEDGCAVLMVDQRSHGKKRGKISDLRGQRAAGLPVLDRLYSGKMRPGREDFALRNVHGSGYGADGRR